MRLSEITAAKEGLAYSYSNNFTSFEEARLYTKRQNNLDNVNHAYYERKKVNGVTLYELMTSWK
jgi:hypothetical protein